MVTLEIKISIEIISKRKKGEKDRKSHNIEPGPEGSPCTFVPRQGEVVGVVLGLQAGGGDPALGVVGAHEPPA